MARLDASGSSAETSFGISERSHAGESLQFCDGPPSRPDVSYRPRESSGRVPSWLAMAAAFFTMAYEVIISRGIRFIASSSN
jgi:hypothetical protein